MDAVLGMTYAVTLLVVTAFSWRKLFQSKPVGTVSFVLWALILGGGNAGGLFGLLLIGWIVYLNREWILSWFYSLTPHPAARIVDRAFKESGSLDVDAFAEAIRDAKGENEYERAARTKQLDQITERWRERERGLREQEARVVESERREMAKENELLHAQTDALEAAIAHEKAAARFEELQRTRRPNDR
jgi:hypothetical protein